MLSFDEIIEKGRINKLCSKTNVNEYNLPKLISMDKQKRDKIELLLNSNLSIEVFSEVLEYFKKTEYRTDFNIDENVKFLLKMQKLLNKYEINIDLDNLVNDYKELMKVLEEEKKIDLMEIRLVKMKHKYTSKFDFDSTIKIMMQKIKERCIDDKEMLKYFAFVNELSIVNEIQEESKIIQKIKNCNESIEKKIFLYLYEHKSEHIGMLADKLGVERLELLQIVIKMEIETDVITFNRINDIVFLKYYA